MPITINADTCVYYPVRHNYWIMTFPSLNLHLLFLEFLLHVAVFYLSPETLYVNLQAQRLTGLDAGTVNAGTDVGCVSGKASEDLALDSGSSFVAGL